MKILQITPDTTSGGAERLALGIHKNFLNNGHDATLLQLTKAPDNTLPNIDSLLFNSPYSAVLKPWKLLHWYYKNGPYDIVHAHLTPTQLLSQLLQATSKPPTLITTEHSTTNRRRKHQWGEFLDEILYKPFRRIICISSGTRLELTANRPGVRSRTSLILNGIELDKFSPPQTRTTDRNKIRVVSVGRLVIAKNYSTAITAISKLKHLKIEYLIAGDGPLKNKLSSLIEELNAQDFISLLGNINDIPKFLQTGDIFLMPSTSEGFGLAAIEAMASGLPLVASNITGLGEVIGTNRIHCITVPPKDPLEISRAITELVLNENLRRRISHEGSKMAKKYSIQTTSHKHIILYKKMLESAHGIAI